MVDPAWSPGGEPRGLRRFRFLSKGTTRIARRGRHRGRTIEERVKRLEGRGVAPEDARARIRAQASSQERRAVASIWIDNEGSAAELEEVAGLVYERWLTPDVPIVD